MSAGDPRKRNGLMYLLLAVIAGLLGWQTWLAHRGAPQIATGSTYQAVLLATGEAYYGRLRAVRPSFLELADVYYVRRRSESDGGGTSVSLVKRGAEWHGPDRMYVNATQVLLIEPVAPESTIGRAIAAHERDGGAPGEIPLE